MSESKSSIHVNVVQNNSERHNKREEKLDYVYEDLSKNNESWEQSKISDRLQAIKDHCLAKSGRKLQKNAEPIREAVVNIKSTTTMADLRRLSDTLQKELKIEAFQIHIHRDEGKSREELNHHAHIVFDWQDKDKGTTIKFNKQGLSQMQNIVSDVLKMERGVTSDKTHLKALQYKNQQEAEKLAFLRDKTAELSTRSASLSKDIGSDIERLGAIKDEQNKELEKLARLQGQNQDIENNAKAYIETNMLGIVNREKTTENIAQLISKNTSLEESNSSLKSRIGELNRDIRSLSNENSNLKSNTRDLAKFKEIAAKAILQPTYNKSYTDEFIKELRLDKDFDKFYKQSEHNYQNPPKDVKKDQNRDRGMSM
jgi:hypothetical protein